MRLSPHSLEGRTALVTGAGSGIGKATAKLLAYSGARVGLLGRGREELEETHAEIKSFNGTSLPLVADISDERAMTDALGQLEREWNALNIVVANAGINGVWAPLGELTPDDWDRTLSVNLRGAYLTVRTSLPLLKRHGGAVVIMASVNGTRMFSNTGATAYAVSNAGRVALSRMLALELAPLGIRVNAICPGAIETEIEDNTERKDLSRIRVPVNFPQGMVPLTKGEPGTAGQVAELVWFLVGDAATHITGTEIFIDGAQSLLQG